MSRVDQPAALAASMRHALRAGASGIAVVAACSGGQVFGLTVSTLIPVALDPPHVLVSVRASSRMLNAIRIAGRFSVSVLSDSQQEIAEEFARPYDAERALRFREFARTHRDIPMIADALAAFDCDLAEIVSIATHCLVVGAVRDVLRADAAGEPLLYCDQRYRRLAR